MSFSNVYKFIIKLEKYKIVNIIYHKLVNTYLTELDGEPIIAKTDTSS